MSDPALPPHPDWVNDLLNRRATVEQKLFNCAAGKAPLPTADDCREWAIKLGVPDELRGEFKNGKG